MILRGWIGSWVAGILMAVCLLGGCASPSENETAGAFSALSGPYLGQDPPGMTPELFAPGAVSTGLGELNAVFFPGGRELIYSVDMGGMRFVLLVTKEDEDGWTEPEVLPFTKIYAGVDPWLSPDGDRIYYCSNRPRVPGESEGDWDIWFVERAGNDWSEPKNVGPPVNSRADEFYPSIAADGTIYFQSGREGGFGRRDLYRSDFTGGQYAGPENLGPAINSEYFEGDVCIAPDESFIIFSSGVREDGFGSGDLYISFRLDSGQWSDAVNMGKGINSRANENCPIFSPDGRYFFFTSRRVREPSPGESITYASLKAQVDGPGNGRGDIYWVDARIVEQFRP
jgi:Tol biopolymer transport system component